MSLLPPPKSTVFRARLLGAPQVWRLHSRRTIDQLDYPSAKPPSIQIRIAGVANFPRVHFDFTNREQTIQLPTGQGLLSAQQNKLLAYT